MTELIERKTNCMSCSALNNESAGFCEKCGSPIGAVSTLDPMGAIQAEGLMMQKALVGRPKFVVLVGIWVMFFPAALISGFAAIGLLTNIDGFGSFFFFLASTALTIVFSSFVYRVTKNYLTIPAPKEIEESRP